MWNLHLDKALGTDGFTIAFYRQHWEIIKNDLARMLKNAFQKKKRLEEIQNPPS